MVYKARGYAADHRNDYRGQQFYDTPEFKALEKVWYAKLKESGFRDIEATGNTHGIMWNPTDHTGCKYTIESVFEYYRTLGLYAHHATFKTAKIRHIMLMYANGGTMRGMSKVTGINKDKLQRTVVPLRERMLKRCDKTHSITMRDINRQSFWVLGLANAKRTEAYVHISELFDKAEIVPAKATEPKGGEYD